MGKTTTVRTIMGLLPPRRRRASFEGQRSTACRLSHRARGLGLVPEGRQIFPNLSVRENLVAAAPTGTAPRRALDARARLRAVPALAERRATWATSSPAASSRCWRSAAR
jgi:branched-chain amino acid transport system ATP-binding protein